MFEKINNFCASSRTFLSKTAKSLQSCPTLCNPIDGSPPGSLIPGILQARILEWVAISFSNAWKWEVKGKSPVIADSSRPHGLQPTRLLHPWEFPGKSTGVGCHCLMFTFFSERWGQSLPRELANLQPVPSGLSGGSTSELFLWSGLW